MIYHIIYGENLYNVQQDNIFEVRRINGWTDR